MLLHAIYLWAFTPEIAEARNKFAQVRQHMGTNWFIERIGLCVCGMDQLRRFHVSIRRSPNGGLDATLVRELTALDLPIGNNLLNRYNIHVSERVWTYLFDGQQPRERYQIDKPVVVWFCASGPVLGIPPQG